MHAKNVTLQPIDACCQVGDLSALRGNLEKHLHLRGDHCYAASCYGGRAQQTLMAAHIGSVKSLTPSQILCCVHAVSGTYEPCFQLNEFCGFGAVFTDSLTQQD